MESPELNNETRNEKKLKNLKFGESIPDIEKCSEYTEQMIQDFKEYFYNAGYLELPPVKITSGTDETVRFIGSHISPMKDYFLNDKIPNEGLMMSQPCVRTRNQPKLFDDNFIPAWGSYFKSMGVLVKPKQIETLCNQSIDYLLNVANIPAKNLVLRINAIDDDLYSLTKKFTSLGIGYDDSTMPEKYYRHKLGIDGVWGRNFNYAIKTDDQLYDIGNLIVLENSEKELGAELALGTSTILKHFFKLPHVNAANPVIGVEKIQNPLKFKLEDSIITSAVLMSEGLRPSASNNKDRILRSYLRAMIYFKNKFIISAESVVEMMRDFENSQNIGNQGSEFIKEYIPYVERSLPLQNQLTPEESKLLEVITNK